MNSDPRTWNAYRNNVAFEASRPFYQYVEPFGRDEEDVAIKISEKFKVPLQDVGDDLIEQYCLHRQNQREEEELEAEMYDEYGDMGHTPD